MRFPLGVAVLCFAGALAACASAEAASSLPTAPPVPVAAEDIWSLSLLAALEASPDGRAAVLAVERPDRAKDRYRGELVAIDLATGEERGVGDPAQSKHRPRFSRDGRELAWLVEGEKHGDLVVARWPRGRPRVVFSDPEGLEDFDWSPDGRAFVVVRRDPAAAGRGEAPPVRITRSLAQRDGEGLLGERRSHLWRVERASGRATQLTSGPYEDSSPAWSPDGGRIAFVSNRHPDPDATDDSDLFLVRPDGSDLVGLPSGSGPDTSPVWSHRGDQLAYLSVRRANDYYQPLRLAVIAPAGTAPLDLTGALDAWVAADSLDAGSGPAAPRWSADDTTIFVPLERRGAAWIAAVPALGGAPREVAGGAAVHGLVRPLPDGGLLYARTDPTHPSELFLAPAGSGEPRRLTHLGDAWLASRRLVAPAKVAARNANGDTVEAWLYPPLDRAPGHRYPLILYIHGGPQGFDGDYFDTDLENQLFPARGWAVLRVNYRGSTSYGEAFSRALWGDWHRREYEDLMAALDAALAGNDWLDPDRLGIGGWSYGGILTLWTVGHSDRFRVGVPERFGFDYLSSFGEDQWFVWYLSELGNPLEHEELYRRLSPGSYLRNVRTPLYLIADAEDRNCPLSQVLQAYQRLKLMGQTTELVVYPGEPHVMARPSHLVDRLRRLTDWFGRHLDRP